jgi:6-phospho-3-hexuloisomerase
MKNEPVKMVGDSSGVGFVEARDVVLTEVARALGAVDPGQVEALVEAILRAGRVFVVGVGRVMLSLQAFAKRLNHLGIRVHCVGDINEPAITRDDLLIVGSCSGKSAVPVTIGQIAHRHGARIALIGSNLGSPLAPIADLFVRIPAHSRLELPDEIPSEQLMTSLFEQALLLLGDAIALMIARRQGLDPATLWQYHANLE